VNQLAPQNTHHKVSFEAAVVVWFCGFNTRLNHSATDCGTQYLVSGNGSKPLTLLGNAWPVYFVQVNSFFSFSKEN